MNHNQINSVFMYTFFKFLQLVTFTSWQLIRENVSWMWRAWNHLQHISQNDTSVCHSDTFNWSPWLKQRSTTSWLLLYSRVFHIISSICLLQFSLFGTVSLNCIVLFPFNYFFFLWSWHARYWKACISSFSSFEVSKNSYFGASCWNCSISPSFFSSRIVLEGLIIAIFESSKYLASVG